MTNEELYEALGWKKQIMASRVHWLAKEGYVIASPGYDPEAHCIDASLILEEMKKQSKEVFQYFAGEVGILANAGGWGWREVTESVLRNLSPTIITEAAKRAVEESLRRTR